MSASTSSKDESLVAVAVTGDIVPKLSQTAPSPYVGSHLALGNFTGSPASTYAGLGVAAATIGQVVGSGGMPTSTAGWITFGLSMAMSLLAAFSHR